MRLHKDGGSCERGYVSDRRRDSVHSSKFKATLREVKLQQDDEEKTINVFDAFARDCNLLHHHDLPAIAVIHFNYENNFIIEVRNNFLL